MTHASTADAPFAAPRDLVRLSVGIESADDLVADLEAALAAVSARALCRRARLVRARAAGLRLRVPRARHAGPGVQLAIGALTWVVLAAACVPLASEQRLRVALVVVAATVGEVTGSLLWGVYSYRLENLPAYIPPGHGLVYLSGLGLASRCGATRTSSSALAAFVAAAWGIAGLGFLPRLDVAGAFGSPAAPLLPLARAGTAPSTRASSSSSARSSSTGPGSACGRGTTALPGLGIPDGNPPSGVASGYVCFDVFAVAVAAWLMPAGTRSAASV